MLVIGCGNRHCGDDAAGILVAEQLQRLGITAKTCSGETTELLEAWKDADDVIVVDAVVTGAPAGTIHSWDGKQAFASVRNLSSTHGFGVAEAIPLAHALDRLPARLLVYGIEGQQFESGGPVSAEVESGVGEVVRRIVAQITSNNVAAMPA